MTARYIIGDTRDVTATLPDGSVDLVMTSPPFLALRSYLPADHPLKDLEIGSEPDPATFIDVLLSLTAEWGRVLAPHGSICVELGDTYSGSSVEGSDQKGSTRSPNGSGMAGLKDSMVTKAGDGWPLAKSMCGIPHLYHLSLAYGRNLLTGEESPAGQWRVRNVVAWCRPNPPVGALGDKFRPATSYLTIATRSVKRYFDLDAVRNQDRPIAKTTPMNAKRRAPERGGQRETNTEIVSNPAGAPPLDYWVIPPSGYTGSHYAVYPPALCERPIDAMVPHRVCTTCGEPSRRITDVTGIVDSQGREVEREKWSSGIADGKAAHSNRTKCGTTTTTTVGWTDCGHDTWRTGVALDPFAGSGTTLMVATGHGRDAIGIDIDARNADLALDRVGPLLLTVEHHTPEAAA